MVYSVLPITWVNCVGLFRVNFTFEFSLDAVEGSLASLVLKLPVNRKVAEVLLVASVIFNFSVRSGDVFHSSGKPEGASDSTEIAVATMSEFPDTVTLLNGLPSASSGSLVRCSLVVAEVVELTVNVEGVQL